MLLPSSSTGSRRRKPMPIIKKLKELFDEAKVGYEVYNYPWAYAARRSLRDNTSLVMRWPRS